MPKSTILVIEDNLDILETLRLLLEHEGFKVIKAENCLKGLECLSRHRPDLILTDLMTPEMNGLEFIHRLRRKSDFDPIPIIAISAYDHTYLAAAIVAGAETALHKPEDLDMLVDTIREVLAKSKPVAAA